MAQGSSSGRKPDAKEHPFSRPLKEWYDQYYENTASTTQAVRQLALGGFAAAWALAGNQMLDVALLKATVGLLVAALATDLLQFFLQSILLRRFLDGNAARLLAEGLPETTRVGPPKSLRSTGYVLWLLKCTFLAGGYVTLSVYVITY